MSDGNDDQRAFRNALGRFATGVTIITTRGPDGKPEGLTANSFSSLSLDPPLVLWSLAKAANSRAAFESCEHFAINVLASHQRSLSHRFATPAEDKFAGVDWSEGIGGAPVIADCIARFECRNLARHEGGDHVIFVGRVEQFENTEGTPLLYFGGRYAAAASHPDDRGGPASDDAFADLLM